ncbi:hypothetical protein H257_13018 [Aphanomyces astaci]|uniref:Uncharacterized protein n=1 Tax=Aphanomyces astaci TaxID=112090 RepID=W4FYX7_APHAT|nr:hypothetical protein H257_13018 [Aphanomyces astaci]ETV71883.1 hypothetical protein H257_13018 [Aphanomyces astaci]|eukprot:XP_009838732.1 hypothetical protein H257_13018 [Aphanomyces astaci]
MRECTNERLGERPTWRNTKRPQYTPGVAAHVPPLGRAKLNFDRVEIIKRLDLGGKHIPRSVIGWSKTAVRPRLSPLSIFMLTCQQTIPKDWVLSVSANAFHSSSSSVDAIDACEKVRREVHDDRPGKDWCFDFPPLFQLQLELALCQGTEDEWNAFADTDGQVVGSNLLEWFADTGDIHMIEFAATPHGKYIGALARCTSFAKPHVARWLAAHNAATNSQGTRICPDLSYGPYADTPGSVLPPGVPTFDEFRTIKIEVGVTQPWGVARGQLDHKALSTWAVMPGVDTYFTGASGSAPNRSHQDPIGRPSRPWYSARGGAAMGVPAALPVGVPEDFDCGFTPCFGLDHALRDQVILM